MKLKDCKWNAVKLSDRTILKGDLKYLSAEQVQSLLNLNVVEVDKGFFKAI